MSFVTRLAGRLWRLPPPLNRDLAVEPLRVPMRDGVELLADRYYSRREMAQPVVLIRSCYGRGTLFKLIALLLAERGVQVVIQSCRGTSGSQGTFRPFLDEQNDGEDSVEWIARQLWFRGDLALWGLSYLGNAAWAIANSRAGWRVKAIGFHMTLTNFRDRTYAFGGFTLRTSIGWTATMLGIVGNSGTSLLETNHSDRRFDLRAYLLRMRRTRSLIQQATATIPLRKADRVLCPEGVEWWQDWMDHAAPGDNWWDPVDYGPAAESLPPAVMVAGWYDIFLPWQLRDFMRAQAAGRKPSIIIGPWVHAALPGMGESLRASIALFQERFGIGPPRKPASAAEPQVRLFIMGANEWREYQSWPIPHTTESLFYLHSGGVLTSKPPDSENSSRFDYDPSRPTPSLHGPTLEDRRGSGDMSALESRPDVLTFSTEPLAADLEAIGPVFADIFLRSNAQYTDLYLCLCDVTPDACSTNLCDGYTRLRAEPAPTFGVRKVRIEFWPTAYRFDRGHRIRVIVAGGAHPRYARNPGGAEPLGDAKSMVVAHHEILHGPEHPSAIILPVQS